MLASFRRLSKSTAGTIIMGLFLLLILVGFAMADIQGVLSGGGFGGGGNGTLAKVGSERVTERELRSAMERRLAEVRQQNPEADYSVLARDFDQLLEALIDSRVLQAFAEKFGFHLSKKLVDAQIAQIPAARGPDGQFSDAAYQSFLAQNRLTDEEVRMALRSDLLQQMLLTPVAANARASAGMATPYASMLLEAREGEVALIPLDAFKRGLNPTPQDLQRYYAENRQRYMVPEQRVLRIARIGPEQVANVQPTEPEITEYYNANQAIYAPKDIRVISQAVVPDQATAQAIANRARGGQSLAAAAAPAGFSAADLALGAQTKQQFTQTAGAEVANAAFAAAEGAVVGPIRSEFGWHVVKIDEVRREAGRPLAAVRSEIAERLATEKRKEAIETLADRVQNAIDDGASFSEAAAAAKLQAIETPPLTAAGTSVANPGYKAPPEVAAVLKTAFELGEGDEPVVEQLPNEGGYVLVAPTRVIPAAPAPFAEVRDRVAQDWIDAQARQRAQQLAQAIAAKAARAPLAQAAQGAPVPVQIEPVRARRLQLAQFQGRVPPPLRMLFSLGQGKVRIVAGAEGEGFYVVKLNKITPGNALTAPGLIAQTQQQLQQSLGQEYGLQFLNALRQTVGVKRNEEAIAAAKRQITGSGG